MRRGEGLRDDSGLRFGDDKRVRDETFEKEMR